jgi:hypothetical protein
MEGVRRVDLRNPKSVKSAGRQCILVQHLQAPPGTVLLLGIGEAPPWSLANFQALFSNLTGEDARPTLWRGLASRPF